MRGGVNEVEEVGDEKVGIVRRNEGRGNERSKW